MGTTLTGTTPANTYDSLIKVTDNGPLSGTGKYLSDGLGNDSKLALSTSNIGINTTSPSYQFDVNGDIRSQGNIRSNNGVVDTVLSYTSEPAGVVGTITNHPTTIWANGAERLRITSTGNIGIGTSSPTDTVGYGRALDIQSATGAAVYLRDSDAPTTQYGFLAFDGQDNGLKLQNANSSGFLRFDTNATERMRITSAGLVGIGTSSPTTSLDVIGSGRFKSSFGDYLLTIENIKDDSQGLLVRASDNDSTPLVKFQSSVGATSETWIDRFVVNKDGNVGIGTTSPNRALEISSFISGAPTGSGFVGGALRLSNTTQYESNYGTGGGNPDSLGSIEFYSGDTSTGTGVRAAIKASVDAYYNSNSLVFYTAPQNAAGIVERARILASGGLTFNGDTAAANALDDYEEGTFTVTASPISSGSITLSTATGSYTKIGNQVSITAFLIVGSVSLPVGAYITMGGLPFAVPNSDRYAGAPSVTYFDAPVYTSQVRPSYIVKNTSGFNVAIDASTVGALDEFYFSLTYFV